MQDSGNKHFSGCGLYLLWFLLLIFFYALVGAIWNFKGGLEQGFPFWLLLARLVVLAALFASTFGLLGRKAWAVWGFFGGAAAMIPVSVSYSYYLSLLTEKLELTLGWIIRNTVVTALISMGVVTMVFFVIRPQQTSSHRETN
jgi:hypothetical protein